MYVSRVKWDNPGKGIAPSPTPRCSNYWKESLLVALDNGRQPYFTTNISILSGLYTAKIWFICKGFVALGFLFMGYHFSSSRRVASTDILDPLSLSTSPYHSSPPADLQGYIPYHHIAAVCMFELVVLLLIGHMRGSTGAHHLRSRPCFSSSVQHVWFV